MENLMDGRYINILVNQGKDIVIFPRSKSQKPVELADGTLAEGVYLTAYYPIELKYPYDRNELAEKIEFGIEQWDKHPCYDDDKEKRTFEEKYYGVNGFKKAVKGTLYFDLGWDEIQGKYVALSLPCKRGYAYLVIKREKLSSDATWVDFADTVINFINMDLNEIDSFKRFKKSLNIAE